MSREVSSLPKFNPTSEWIANDSFMPEAGAYVRLATAANMPHNGQCNALIGSQRFMNGSQVGCILLALV